MDTWVKILVALGVLAVLGVLVFPVAFALINDHPDTRLLLGLLAVLGVLVIPMAFAITNHRPHTWWGIRHIRYYRLTNLIMGSHAHGTVAGVPYKPTEEELQYIDDVREGKA